MLSKPLGSTMYINLVIFGMRYGTNKEENAELGRGVEMTDKG